MNTNNTIKAIKNVVIPCYNEAKTINRHKKFKLSCDNARAHTSKKTQRFMNSRECPPYYPLGGHPINTKGGTPPNSPDLCPIEYIP